MLKSSQRPDTAALEERAILRLQGLLAEVPFVGRVLVKKRPPAADTVADFHSDG